MEHILDHDQVATRLRDDGISLMVEAWPLHSHPAVQPKRKALEHGHPLGELCHTHASGPAARFGTSLGLAHR